MAFSLSILLNIFSSGLRRVMVSEEYQQAIVIAQSKLAAAGVEKELEDGNEQGSIEDKYFWSVNIRLFNVDQIGLDADAVPLTPYQVTARVEWAAGTNNRELELTTLKLAKQQ